MQRFLYNTDHCSTVCNNNNNNKKDNNPSRDLLPDVHPHDGMSIYIAINMKM